MVVTLLEPLEPPLRGEVWGPRDVAKPEGEDGIPEIEPHGSRVSRIEFQHSDTTPPDWSAVVVLETWVKEARFVSLEY